MIKILTIVCIFIDVAWWGFILNDSGRGRYYTYCGPMYPKNMLFFVALSALFDAAGVYLVSLFMMAAGILFVPIFLVDLYHSKNDTDAPKD